MKFLRKQRIQKINSKFKRWRRSALIWCVPFSAFNYSKHIENINFRWSFYRSLKKFPIGLSHVSEWFACQIPRSHAMVFWGNFWAPKWWVWDPVGATTGHTCEWVAEEVQCAGVTHYYTLSTYIQQHEKKMSLNQYAINIIRLNVDYGQVDIRVFR